MKRLFTFLSRANNNSVGIHLFNQHRVSSIYSMLTLVAIMLMVPYSMRGATTTIDFGPAGIAATNWSATPPQSNYETHLYMSNEDYNTIGNGAKVGDRIDYKYNSSAYTTLNISRLAFIHNTNGVGGADIDGDGFYLRYEKTIFVAKLVKIFFVIIVKKNLHNLIFFTSYCIK